MLSTDQYEVMYTLHSELFSAKVKGICKNRRTWMKNVTPAEREVLLKYRKKGVYRGLFGGIMGAFMMAGVWKIAALGSTVGIVGVIVGGLAGAWFEAKRREFQENVLLEGRGTFYSFGEIVDGVSFQRVRSFH